jgi:hypothetical protein
VVEGRKYFLPAVFGAFANLAPILFETRNYSNGEEVPQRRGVAGVALFLPSQRDISAGRSCNRQIGNDIGHRTREQLLAMKAL